MNFNVNIKVNKEVLSMFDIIETSKAARRWAWSLTLAIPSAALFWKAADIITALHAAFKH
jgi:hypothetical protein